MYHYGRTKVAIQDTQLDWGMRQIAIKAVLNPRTGGQSVADFKATLGRIEAEINKVRQSNLHKDLAEVIPGLDPFPEPIVQQDEDLDGQLVVTSAVHLKSPLSEEARDILYSVQRKYF